MFSNNTAEIPSDAPEKAKTIIRKIKGINGFFSINLCSNVSKVTVLEAVSKKSTTQARLDRGQKDSIISASVRGIGRIKIKIKEQIDAASVDRTQYLQNA
jgi:hypothetical protein